MNNLLAFISSVFSSDILSDDFVVILSQVLFTALLSGFAAYHLDWVKKEALKAEKIAIKDKSYDD